MSFIFLYTQKIYPTRKSVMQMVWNDVRRANKIKCTFVRTMHLTVPTFVSASVNLIAIKNVSCCETKC